MATPRLKLIFSALRPLLNRFLLNGADNAGLEESYPDEVLFKLLLDMLQFCIDDPEQFDSQERSNNYTKDTLKKIFSAENNTDTRLDKSNVAMILKNHRKSTRPCLLPLLSDDPWSPDDPCYQQFFRVLRNDPEVYIRIEDCMEPTEIAKLLESWIMESLIKIAYNGQDPLDADGILSEAGTIEHNSTTDVTSEFSQDSIFTQQPYRLMFKQFRTSEMTLQRYLNSHTYLGMSTFLNIHKQGDADGTLVGYILEREPRKIVLYRGHENLLTSSEILVELASLIINTGLPITGNTIFFRKVLNAIANDLSIGALDVNKQDIWEQYKCYVNYSKLERVIDRIRYFI